jgi:hypothetical protein
MKASPDILSPHHRDYLDRVEQAKNFAGEDPNNPSWFGLLQIGLAMVNLDVIPINMFIEPEPYWTKVVAIGLDYKEVYWVAERDFFSKNL